MYAKLKTAYIQLQNKLSKFRYDMDGEFTTKWDDGAVPLNSTTNISVKLLRRRITECKVQAIVISENRKLDPSGGLAKSVLQAAGRSVWDDLKRQTKGRVQEPGTVLFTNGGALREIKHIIHIVTPIWGNYRNRTGKMECLYILQSAIFACLKDCIDKSLTSFALAAIGAGNCGIPARLCSLVYACALLKIDEYSRLRNKNLQIYLVDISEINLTTISKNYNSAFSRGYNSAVDEISKEVENVLGIISHNIREGFQVKAYKGDISVFREGSILCAVNKHLDAVGKDEEHIANQAGAVYKQKLQVLRRARKYKGGQVAETIAGDLSSHLILHCIIPSKKKWPFGREGHYREKLIACYRNAFQLASEHGNTVVALSILGIESAYMGMDVCCSTLIDALRILSDEGTSLKQLHIVCREDYLLSHICTLLNNLKI
ncbi:hypothetical protein ACJMK2_022755 [Sinanodonta woodiana]|uniref:Macro domain-containing protein n=1 Tax=Sinanodonta woodiana TaxID=1069815 RepID=A0ABD3TK05_SINWO